MQAQPVWMQRRAALIDWRKVNNARPPFYLLASLHQPLPRYYPHAPIIGFGPGGPRMTLAPELNIFARIDGPARPILPQTLLYLPRPTVLAGTRVPMLYRPFAFLSDATRHSGMPGECTTVFSNSKLQCDNSRGEHDAAPNVQRNTNRMLRSKKATNSPRDIARNYVLFAALMEQQSVVLGLRVANDGTETSQRGQLISARHNLPACLRPLIATADLVASRYSPASLTGPFGRITSLAHVLYGRWQQASMLKPKLRTRAL